MDNDAPASISSLSPISGAQSFALTDEQRLALIAKAEAGNPESAFRLSLYYTFTFSDAEQSMHWLSMAAKGGHGMAQHSLAYDKQRPEWACWRTVSLSIQDCIQSTNTAAVP